MQATTELHLETAAIRKAASCYRVINNHLRRQLLQILHVLAPVVPCFCDFAPNHRCPHRGNLFFIPSLHSII